MIAVRLGQVDLKDHFPGETITCARRVAEGRIAPGGEGITIRQASGSRAGDVLGKLRPPHRVRSRIVDLSYG